MHLETERMNEEEETVDYNGHSASNNDDRHESRLPVIHAPVDAPYCHVCHENGNETSFFNSKCAGCQDLLCSPSITVPELFAILRQWMPPVQQSLELIIRQMLKVGAHVDDRDGLTDMTMLHYASKAGCRGMGDAEEACRMVNLLLSHGADPYIRCRWTNMAAVHYAAYFDVAPVLTLLLKASKSVDIDSPCSEFDHGSPLHIAVRNLAYQSVRVLLQSGADPRAKDMSGKLPVDWLPDPASAEPDSETGKIIGRLRSILEEAEPSSESFNSRIPVTPQTSSKVSQILKAFGIKVGDKVVVGGVKSGILRYCGPTMFADGFWAGIELDEAVGKNNGSVDGLLYFRCPPNYGIFAPIHKISRPGILMKSQSRGSLQRLNHSKIDVGHVTAKVNTGLRNERNKSALLTVDEDVNMSDRVLVAGKKTGIVMYFGETDFAPGLWYGIQLDKPDGKNDGSVDGQRYFTCEPKRGVFAPPSRVQRISDTDIGNDRITNGPSLSVSSVDICRQLTTDLSLQSTPLNKASLLTGSKTVGNCGSTKGSPYLATFGSQSSGELRLTEGMNVFCCGEIGIVRFIGSVEFADGVWLGVELKTLKGKHDGSVQGRRYFNCRPGHGLLVRPSKVTYRGINGSKLVFN